MSRIYEPLKSNHPLVKDGILCPICNKPFLELQRTVLLTASMNPYKSSTVPAIPVHATCGLKGFKGEFGEIERIKDGDGSPYPIVTTEGKQFKLSEFGLV